ncbi:MAG: glycosyltransferase [Myxococcales bacterium]
MPTSKPQLQVLLLSGEQREQDGSRIYRCVFKAKELVQAGAKARVMFWGDAKPADLKAADAVILSRCTWQPGTIELIERARSYGKLVCGDLDDRIFTPWEARNTGYMRTKALNKQDQAALVWILQTQRNTLRLLPAFDQVFVSTERLRHELDGLGIPAMVSRNAVDETTMRPLAKVPRKLERILFMTGTKTHDADFRALAPALWRFLETHADVRLTLLGPLDLPWEARAFPQVQAVAKLPMTELPGFVASHDACLVPLEDTAFNDCKSALKYLECGLVSVPVIASPRQEFRALIRAGENGMFAETERDWHDALCALYDSPELLRRLAQTAHRDVLDHHTVASRGDTFRDQLHALLSAREHEFSLAPVPRSP